MSNGKFTPECLKYTLFRKTLLYAQQIIKNFAYDTLNGHSKFNKILVHERSYMIQKCGLRRIKWSL